MAGYDPLQRALPFAIGAPFQLGTHRIAGTLTVEGTPASRKLYLLDARDRIVRTQKSDATGAFAFDHIGPGRYTVIARDARRFPQFEPAAADFVQAVYMPNEVQVE